MFTLKRLNIVKKVESEAKAQALVAKGFKIIQGPEAKAPNSEQKPQTQDNKAKDTGKKGEGQGK